MSKNNTNKNNDNVKEEVKQETVVTENQGEGQNNDVQNPPAPVEGDGKEKKGFFQGVKDGWCEFWDEEKHPVRNKVGKGLVKVGKGAVVVTAVAGATVGVLALAGSKKANSDSEDEDDYDDYDGDDQEDSYDDDNVVAEAEAKEIDE